MPLCRSKVEQVTTEDLVELSEIEKHNLGQVCIYMLFIYIISFVMGCYINLWLWSRRTISNMWFFCDSIDKSVLHIWTTLPCCLLITISINWTIFSLNSACKMFYSVYWLYLVVSLKESDWPIKLLIVLCDSICHMIR